MKSVHDFLLAEEGYTEHGYVPNNGGEVIGQSGLTVAAGVDIGQMGRSEFNNLPMSVFGREVLLPFVGLRGDEALRMLERHRGAKITVADGEAISNYMFNRVINGAKEYWQNFDALPENAQIVLVSLAYNLGLKGSPSTSGKVASGKFKEAAAELRDPNEWANRELDGRRNREADLLEEILS
jgi:hypothetical protein